LEGWEEVGIRQVQCWQRRGVVVEGEQEVRWGEGGVEGGGQAQY
jgi:hypothetical protein